MDLVSVEDLEKLLDRFAVNAYSATQNSEFIQDAQHKCEALFAKDYKFNIINNTDGELSATYPSRIIHLQGEKNTEIKDVCDRLQNSCDTQRLKNLMTKARNSRCRTRFPVPVILFEGKNICRSATIATGGESFGRKFIEFLGSAIGTSTEPDNEPDADAAQNAGNVDNRASDVNLLRGLSVNHICDLMVEHAKVKFKVYCSSSEKNEQESYRDFNLLCMPYPGCEFFEEFRKQHHCAENLMFNWKSQFVNAPLVLPSETMVFFSNLGIEFTEYEKWDLVTLTQNYMKVLLRYLTEGTSGILIHCISGWDRTPLFISLLRLSLWADGKIHTTLTEIEMLYLTVVYDWFLFGHKLPDRLKKGEEILYFCFYIIKFLMGEEFSTVKRKELKHSLNPVDPNLEVLREENYFSLGSESSSCRSVNQHSPSPSNFSVHSRESSPCNNGNATVPKDYTPPKHEALFSDSNLNTSCTSSLPRLIDQYSSVPVPVPSARKRTDSTSSTGCGSWQIISGAGSIRGSESSRSSNSLSSEVNQNLPSDRSAMHSTGTGVNLLSTRSVREEKLDRVRTCFHKVYTTVVGWKHGSPAETGTFSTFYQLAEKVLPINTAKTPE